MGLAVFVSEKTSLVDTFSDTFLWGAEMINGQLLTAFDGVGGAN
jgi:hypothetical protein